MLLPCLRCCLWNEREVKTALGPGLASLLTSSGAQLRHSPARQKGPLKAFIHKCLWSTSEMCSAVWGPGYGAVNKGTGYKGKDILGNDVPLELRFVTCTVLTPRAQGLPHSWHSTEGSHTFYVCFL